MHAIATETEPDNTASEKTAQQFTLWACERLNLDVTGDDEGRFWLAVPPDHVAAFDDQSRVPFTFDKEIYAAGDNDLELVAPGGRLLGWLIERVRQLGNVAHAAPADQPTSVHEISGRLFSAYHVDGGSARLAGCSLEDKLVLRFTFRLRLEGLEPRDELLDVHLADDGQPLSDAVRDSLGLQQIVPVERPPRVNESDIQWLVEAGLEQAESRRQAALQQAAAELAPRRHEEERQLAEYFSKTRAEVAKALSAEQTPEERAAIEEQLAALDAQLQRRLAGLEERYSVQGQIELVATTLLWCKQASGKLRFTFGSYLADLPFAGWARTLVAPPLVCEHTGAASHNVAATDDGRISVAEEIQPCQRSGRRVLRRELTRCTVTGQQALAEFISHCPVTGEPLLTDQLTLCQECQQLVGPPAIVAGRCSACRQRQEVSKADARLARVFGEHPKLDRWRSWSIGETESVYNLAAHGFLKRLLVIVDKQSLEILHMATGSRLSAAWTAVEPAQFEQVST